MQSSRNVCDTEVRALLRVTSQLRYELRIWEQQGRKKGKEEPIACERRIQRIRALYAAWAEVLAALEGALAPVGDAVGGDPHLVPYAPNPAYESELARVVLALADAGCAVNLSRSTIDSIRHSGCADGAGQKQLRLSARLAAAPERLQRAFGAAGREIEIELVAMLRAHGSARANGRLAVAEFCSRGLQWARKFVAEADRAVPRAMQVMRQLTPLTPRVGRQVPRIVPSYDRATLQMMEMFIAKARMWGWEPVDATLIAGATEEQSRKQLAPRAQAGANGPEVKNGEN